MPPLPSSATPKRFLSRRQSLAVVSGGVVAIAAACSGQRTTDAEVLALPGDTTAGGIGWHANTTPAPSPAITPAPTWLAARCPHPDAGLAGVASAIVRGQVEGHDGDAVTRALRTAGSAFRDPRVWMMAGPALEPATCAELLTTAMGHPTAPAQRRCGLAYARSPLSESAAVIVADTLAEPESVPLRARTGTWVRLRARVFGSARAAKFVVAGPTRPPKTLPTSLSGDRVSAVVALDEPGPWLVQLLVDGSDGPSPALDAAVFVDCEPSESPWLKPAPGEDDGSAPMDVSVNVNPAALADAVARMIDQARARTQLAPLERDAALDRMAERHAQAMRRSHRLGHDLGLGDPVERLSRAGITTSSVGENLAHARTAGLAHRALWYSPSHRMNLLGERFVRMGVGAALDPDGSVWIAELFAPP